MQDWRERFEEKFSHVGTDERDLDGQLVREDIKAFITELLVERDREWREALKMEKKDECYCEPWTPEGCTMEAWNECIDELNERIAKL